MSTATLTSLRDYLYGTLSAEEMIWLVDELTGYIRKGDELKPYTIEELHARIARAEADIAAGRVTPHEEVMREWKEELAREEQEELEMATAGRAWKI